jgi:hypothetical protein
MHGILHRRQISLLVNYNGLLEPRLNVISCIDTQALALPCLCNINLPYAAKAFEGIATSKHISQTTIYIHANRNASMGIPWAETTLFGSTCEIFRLPASDEVAQCFADSMRGGALSPHDACTWLSRIKQYADQAARSLSSVIFMDYGQVSLLVQGILYECFRFMLCPIDMITTFACSFSSLWHHLINLGHVQRVAVACYGPTGDAELLNPINLSQLCSRKLRP